MLTTSARTFFVQCEEFVMRWQFLVIVTVGLRPVEGCTVQLRACGAPLGAPVNFLDHYFESHYARSLRADSLVCSGRSGVRYFHSDFLEPSPLQEVQ